MNTQKLQSEYNRKDRALRDICNLLPAIKQADSIYQLIEITNQLVHLAIQGAINPEIEEEAIHAAREIKTRKGRG